MTDVISGAERNISKEGRSSKVRHSPAEKSCITQYTIRTDSPEPLGFVPHLLILLFEELLQHLYALLPVYAISEERHKELRGTSNA